MANRKGNFSAKTKQILCAFDNHRTSIWPAHTVRTLATYTKIKQSTIYQTLHRLRHRGLVSFSKSGLKWGGNVWVLTDAGRAMVSSLGSES